ncbi:hypothetical protein LOC68_17385 [Blastopirellula sp. JC732]|uniref:Uncharacterized protein n=1 Tax=Blastopirellula sediminis TaxID=2894196 RepID=A0A9X1MPV4_9BACT|nr:hypothetical protein [Blastopirellula sediminis]MCC9606532.1 hypothetical protein [Blastopirellula sediminis]MCC9630170.1 hypothetical protein [Blastopirellula sediminis]
MNSKFLAATLVGVAILAAVGCSKAGDGRERFPISGTVNFQGSPLPEGKLVLLPADGEVNAGPTQVVMIEQGAFDGESTPGLKRVEFYASWPNGKMITLENGSQVEDTATLPPSCNVHSKYELDVQRAPNEGIVWDLK